MQNRSSKSRRKKGRLTPIGARQALRDFRPLERTTDVALGAFAALAFTSTGALNEAFRVLGLSLIGQDLWVAAALCFAAVAAYTSISRYRRGLSRCEQFTVGLALASLAGFLTPLALGGFTLEP